MPVQFSSIIYSLFTRTDVVNNTSMAAADINLTSFQQGYRSQLEYELETIFNSIVSPGPARALRVPIIILEELRLA